MAKTVHKDLIRNKKGKPFYSFLYILILFAVLPTLIGAGLSLTALRRADGQASNYLVAALETQLAYHDTTSPSRKYAKAANQLKESSELLNRLAGLDSIADSEDVQIAENLLDSLGNDESADVSWYLYFAGSSYLLEQTGNRQEPNYENLQQVIGLIDPSDCEYSHNYFGPDGKDYFKTTYAAVIVPNVILLVVDQFDPGTRQNEFFSYDVVVGLKECQIANYDSFGNFHSYSEQTDLIGLYNYDTVGNDSNGFFTFKHEGKNYLCIYITKEFNHTRFVLFCRNEIAEYHQSLSLLLVVGVCLLIAVFLIIAFMQASRMYNPISSLVSRLNYDNSSKEHRDDFVILEGALASLDTMNFKLQKQSEILRNTCLYHLLNGDSIESYRVYLEDWLEAGKGKTFAVAILRGDANAASGLTGDELEEQVLLFFHKQGYELLTLWNDDRLIVVMDMQSQTVTQLSQSFEILKQEQGGYFSVFLSALHSGPEQLHSCYEETEAVAAYCQTLEKYDTILDYESVRDAVGDELQTTHAFSLLNTLADYISNLSVDDCLRQYDTIVHRYFIKAENHKQSDNLPVSALVNTIAMAFYDISLPGDVSKENIVSYVDKIRCVKDVGSLRQYMKECLESCKNQNIGQNYNRERFEQIKAYVNEHFSNPNLSAGEVAEQFRISQSGVTYMFKSFNQSGFLEYLHNLRVRKSITLLEETNMSVSEIAALVGYTNTTTMTRAFKKYAHATPGMVRKIASV